MNSLTKELLLHKLREPQLLKRGANFLLKKLLIREVVYDYNYFCKRKLGHALLYYKTEQFMFENRFFDARRPSRGYTSNWEEVEIARVLNRLGFWVDIVDREVSAGFLPENKYDIFIGNGAGNSGKYYAKYAKHLTKALRLFYANGPESDISNRLMEQRYLDFNIRHPDHPLDFRRLITEVDIQESMRYTDAILCFGNSFSQETYRQYNKPIYQVIPSTSSYIKTDLEQLQRKNKNKFLYFGGHGNLVKGLDLLLEAFEKTDRAELYICAPYEPDLMGFYRDVFERPNIHYMGFIEVGGPEFDRLTSECGYIIFPSSSEGTATSVVTCMRRGLIPVVTYETGVDLEDFGILIEDIGVEALYELICSLAEMADRDFLDRVFKTYIYSQRFTEDAFSKNYENIILRALMHHGYFPETR